MSLAHDDGIADRDSDHGNDVDGNTKTSSSTLVASQSSPANEFIQSDDSAFRSCNKRRKRTVKPQHFGQSRSDGVAEALKHFEKRRDNEKQQQQQQHGDCLRARRRHTMPAQPNHLKRNIDTFYSEIRFDRQNIEYNMMQANMMMHHRRKNLRPFPRPDEIQDFASFYDKYKFVTSEKDSTRRLLLGFGSQSAVYKATLLSNRMKKFAVKSSQYRGRKDRSRQYKQERMLHKFGAGLEVKHIYDDTVNHRLLFVQNFGKDLKTWWHAPNAGLKRKFDRADVKTQEWILKKITFEILLSLKQIHDAGYIHHDIKPQNILVIRRKSLDAAYHQPVTGQSGHWIDRWSFHIIDYGLSRKCAKGDSIAMRRGDIQFGTFGYNAWELMKTHEDRSVSHSIDLYALGLTICELVHPIHILRSYNDFRRKQDDYCYPRLIEHSEQHAQQQRQEFEDESDVGLSEYQIYMRTLKLKCEFWIQHFEREHGVSSYNGDESSIRHIVVNQLHANTPYTTRFKNFISNLVRDNPKIRIATAEDALNHDLFYNL